MAKKSDCCPCPLTIAREKVRAAKTCEQLNAAADAFLNAATDELAMKKPSPAKVLHERLLNAEFDRIAQKASVRCQFPAKSAKAVDAITKARLDVQRAIRAAKTSRERADARISRALKEQSAASQLAALRAMHLRSRHAR